MTTTEPEGMQDKQPIELAPRPQRRYQAWLFQGYVLAALLAFSALALLASSRAYFSLDLGITRLLQAREPAWLGGLMRAVSWPGFAPQAVFTALAPVALLFWLGRRREAGLAALAAFGANLANFLVKYVVHRPRPGANLVRVVQVLDSFSFPSGHVMFYTAFFGFLGFLAYTLLKPSPARGGLVGACTALVVLVGPSRIYLGQHWASDVLGGYLLGSLVLLGIIQLYRTTGGRGDGGQRPSPAPPAAVLTGKGEE